ncbi:imidazolonepropionase-like amidohydrolase [Salirhabdus euzebyi]|uniref:Imidazolonepropionase-like amidohydrolase n=1 Tax=Salirhabdus euzebyi TaxID=394506 RepID=A0A841Q8L7_9BACI|nr:amidohydrolase [Salirhabdus euzebyi]MBB6454811.1 imidazolonepropionase-like amidohydrolase [Salirhabdus euzebyi]
MKAIIHATGYDGKGNSFTNKTIIIQNGKIVEISDRKDFSNDVDIIDATGKVVTPGLIDVHTHLGVFEQGIGKEGHDFNETSSPTTAEIRALDGINPFDQGFEDARQGGITTVQILPGSANVIGGEMVIVKTYGKIVDEMVVKSPSGLKAATGENPKRVHGGKGNMPTTRMGVAALLRKKLIEAQNYLMKMENGNKERNLEMENIGKVLKMEIPLRVHAHRAEDIATVLRLKNEFNIDLTIEHGTEGHLIADYIAAHNVSVAVGPTMTSRSKVELVNRGWHTLPAYVKAGVPFAITTDHPVVTIENLMTSAILAVKHGLDEKIAMQAITYHAAMHLGIEKAVGSIESGKDADIVLWNGDPFDLRNSVETTVINGNIVYQK